jgi:hypothetical protein
MNALKLVKTLSAHLNPAGTTVTLALDLSRSGRLPEPTRLFLKHQVYWNLVSEARPEETRDVLRRISRRIREFVEKQVRPETDGLFLVAGPGVWETVELRLPLRNLLAVGRAPYLAPLIEAGRRAPRAFVVELGARKGRVEEVFLGESVKTWVLNAPAPEADAQHATAPRGGAERDLHQRRGLEAARKMAREAAALVAARHHEAPAEAVFLVKPSATFVDHLPGDLRERAAPLGGKGVVQALEERYAERAGLELEAFQDARSLGLQAALGPREVLEALASGTAGRVFVNPDDPSPGVTCVDCGSRFPELRARCPYCEGAVVAASMTQEVVAHALAHPPLGLTFVRTTEPWLAELGGMAALLRTKGARRSRSANGVLAK